MGGLREPGPASPFSQVSPAPRVFLAQGRGRKVKWACFRLGSSEEVENKRLKRGSLPRDVEETQAFHSARATSQLETAARCTEPTGASPTPSGSRASPGGGLEVTGRGPRRGKAEAAAADGSSPWAPFPPAGLAVAAGGLQSIGVAESRP